METVGHASRAADRTADRYGTGSVSMEIKPVMIVALLFNFESILFQLRKICV